MSLEPERGAFVFFSYVHQDKWLRDRLEDHLSNLKYRGLITTWHDQEIRAGEEWTRQIDIVVSYLNKAHIILLLISSHFMASEFYYSIEMWRALERHDRQEADVIPILLRSLHFIGAPPFAKFQMLPTNRKIQMLPTNRKPVMRWRDRDSAFFDIACGIERVAQKYSAPPERQQQEARQLKHCTRRAIMLIGCVGGVAAFITAAILAWVLQHPTLIPLGIDLFVSTLGLLLLIAGIAAVRKVIGVIHARSEQRRAYYEKAIAAYRRALSRNPSDGDAHRGMGNALYALGYYDQALDAFTRAIDCDSTPAAYAGLGDVFARLKRYSEAVAAYEKAIELDPTVTLNHGDLMRALLALGRKEEAERVRARAKQLGYEDDR
jgi:hypothetical protein